MRMNKKLLRSVLFILGTFLVFLPRILSFFFNISLEPFPRTVIFIGAVVLLIAGMVIPKDDNETSE